MKDDTVGAMRFQRRSGGLRPEPSFTVSALRAPARYRKEQVMFQRNAVKVLHRVRQTYYNNLDDGIGDRSENKRVIAALGVAIKALRRPDYDEHDEEVAQSEGAEV